MKLVEHEMIAASAGSGKTHELATLYLKLLALGVPPERIAALTFTRKAAAEFFDKILSRLATAASNEDEAKKLAREIDVAGFGAHEAATILAMLVRGMHLLRLGTIDSFFSEIVRSFPLELGLASVPQILEDAESARARLKVFSQLFAIGDSITAAQKDFLEAFRLATFGKEEKKVADSLEQFLERNFDLYRRASDRELWGKADTIWPDGSQWKNPPSDISPAVRALREWTKSAAMRDRTRDRWENFCTEAEQWKLGAVLDSRLEYVFEKVLPVWGDVLRGNAKVKFDRDLHDLDATACEAVEQIVCYVIGSELGRRLLATQGIWSVLHAIDAVYDVEIRRMGWLTFADIEELLSRWPLLGDDTALSERRLLINYRLDARIDHWLLDEFQDTSFRQWKILEPLIDEVVQDTSGRRSLFCVGDVKQSIYGWRSGDPKLFDYVFRRYERVMRRRDLVRSWRSGPEIIEMVNQQCAAPSVLSKNSEAAEFWRKNWQAHESARPEISDRAEVFYVEKSEERWPKVLELIRDVDPIGRGLTAAVLVRKNDTANEVANFLRSEGVPAIAEADLRIAHDNPVCAGLLALLRAALAPDDTVARRHVEFSPLCEILRGEGAWEASAFSAQVLGEVFALGFEGWVRSWERRLTAILRGDAFSVQRLQQFAAMARGFDSDGNRDVEAFLAAAERFALREISAPGVVSVMTVHKAKGLGFDFVVAPDLADEWPTSGGVQEDMLVSRAEDGTAEWILQNPGKWIVEVDPVLTGFAQEKAARQVYESACVRYVALTRAKRFQFLIAKKTKQV